MDRANYFTRVGRAFLVVVGLCAVVTSVGFGPAAALEPQSDGNRPPVLWTIGDQQITAGEELMFSIAADDPDGDVMYLEVLNAPAGSRLDGRTGEFRWTPSSSQAGKYRPSFKVKDEHGAYDVETISITVLKGSSTGANFPPVLNPLPKQEVRVGQALRFAISAYDPDNDTMYAFCKHLPSGASFDDRSGAFSWVPKSSDVGRHRVTFMVKDEHNAKDKQRVTIKVTR